MPEHTEDRRRLDAEKNLRRLVIAESDLFQAYRFADLLLEYEDGDASNEQDRAAKDLATALDIALVVAYCRPFLNSQGGQHANTALKIRKHLRRTFSDRESKLHDSIVEQRSKEFAHSDADSYSPSISKTPFGLMPIMRDPFPYVDFERARVMKNMIAKIMRSIGDENKRLSSEIPMGTTIHT